MGLLDDLLGGLTQGGAGQRGQRPASGGQGGGMAGIVAALLPVVLGMMAGRQRGGGQMGGAMGGGLGDLLEQFQRAGFGDQARSWVGTGQNLPISPDVLTQVFGRDGVTRIASQAGLSEEEASSGLSELLPEVVDRMTPEGRVPGLDSLAASADDLGRRFGI
jgi:uncharacterized protein YidB (DUF937 family)